MLKHPWEKNLWQSLKKELPLDLLISYNKRSDRSKYQESFVLDKDKYPCVQTAKLINNLTMGANKNKAFTQRLTRYIKLAIKAKLGGMESKDQTPTTPNPSTPIVVYSEQDLGAVGSGTISPG